MTEKIRLMIDGMSCQHCVNNVKKTIEKLEGVISSDVSIGSAVIEIDDKIVSRVNVENAIIDAGYKINQ